MNANPNPEVATSKDVAELGELRESTGWYASMDLLAAAVGWENMQVLELRAGALDLDSPTPSRIIAATSALAAGKVGVIGNVVVHSDYRRRGLGRLMTSAALEWLRSRHAGAVCVTSVASRDSREWVYNLEVQNEHVYEVCQLGILVHNDCLDQLRVAKEDPSKAVHRLESALGDPKKKDHQDQVAHHIIPLSLADHPVVVAAARAGWTINGAENGVWMNKSAHETGNTHPAYTRDLRDYLNALEEEGLSDDECAVVLMLWAAQLRGPLSGRRKPLE